MADERPPAGRRILGIVSFIVAAVVIYGLAFERVGVDLDEIQSETRQDQLVGIIRNLFNPELVDRDSVEESVLVDVSIPCGPEVSGVTENEVGRLVVDPACGEPEDTVIVSGSGFEPGARGRILFIPQSDVSGLFLPLVQVVEVGEDGSFSYEVELPDRESDQLQQIEARISTPQGTWTNRVEVWEDTNENGIRDEGVIEDGSLTVTIEDLITVPEVPAVALLDSVQQVEAFVTSGESFEATNGQADGQVAIPLSEVDPEGSAGVQVTAIDLEASTLAFEIAGPEGLDVSDWRVAVYDGATGEVLEATPLGDVVRLSPRISDTAVDSIDKIIDTVFLALVATTVGLIVAVPLSFLSARNLMRDISTPTINLGLGLIAVPVGVFLGAGAVQLLRSLLDPLRDSGITAIVSAAALSVAVAYGVRWAFARLAEGSLARIFAFVGAGAIALAALDNFGIALERFGVTLRPLLGPVGFIAGLFSTLGEVVVVILPLLGALAGAGVVVNVATRFGYWLRAILPDSPRKTLALAVTAVAGALWAALIGAAISWLYQIDNPTATLWIPLVVGTFLGLLIGMRGLASGEVRTGLTVYYISRTVFNTLRSIEPLVMAIVFVVWVGFGEFAGSLALALHTAAALAKLYSEQVESILPGPMEAVRATGATRLQSVVYAVVPQIVPPYISFTMYRWDINVRMSTILGFVGGGGIGFILQQNVNLGQYRAAAVQMLAIAIVVATMDWLSARLREQLI